MVGEPSYGPGTRCITYSRVSTRGQAERGFSLGQQTEALLEYAIEHEFEIVEEIQDPGFSGAYLERPGLDRVRDLVEAGNVDVVLVQDLDRLTREPGHLWLLEQEFEVHGCEVRALNDDGDKSPEGELMRGMKGQIAKFERAKINERMRRGKKAKARRGKILPSRPAPYGYVHRDGELMVDEGRMFHVRNTFHTVAGGGSIKAVVRALDESGVPTPGGAPTWVDSTIRRWFDCDAYRPHTYSELVALEPGLAPDVLAKLDPDETYGIFYYNQLRTKKINGHNTRKVNDRTEWIPVPIPDAGIPLDVFEKARCAVADNLRPPDANRRFWELKSLLFCPCGRQTTTFTAHRKHKDKSYYGYYYVCSERRRRKAGACEYARHHNVKQVEAHVRAFILSLLREPETMLEHVREDVERERKRLKRADGERAGWFTELAEVERKRDIFVEMRADGDLSKEKFRDKVAGLDARRDTAEQELERLNSEGSAEQLAALDALPSLVEEYLRDLPYLVHGGQTPIRDYVTVGAERTADNPLGVYTLTPEAVRERSPREMEELRKRAERERGERFRAIYETLRLRIVAHADGTLDISGTFGVRGVNRVSGASLEEAPLPNPDEDGVACRHGERGPRPTRSQP